MKHHTSITRLAVRRLLTIEVAVNAFLGLGTAAAVGVTVWVCALVWRLIP